MCLIKTFVCVCVFQISNGTSAVIRKDFSQHTKKAAHLVLSTARSIHGAVQLWVAGGAHRAPQGAANILERRAEPPGVILTSPLVCEPNVHVFFMKSNSTNLHVVRNKPLDAKGQQKVGFSCRDFVTTKPPNLWHHGSVIFRGQVGM